jgi:hypothetical protein
MTRKAIWVWDLNGIPLYTCIIRAFMPTKTNLTIKFYVRH